MVIKNPTLGIIVKQALKVETDPVTGRITTVADDMPQLPFSHFRLHFREGTRSPLAIPPVCGTYNATAVLTPWSGGRPGHHHLRLPDHHRPRRRPLPHGRRSRPSTPA